LQKELALRQAAASGPLLLAFAQFSFAAIYAQCRTRGRGRLGSWLLVSSCVALGVYSLLHALMAWGWLPGLKHNGVAVVAGDLLTLWQMAGFGVTVLEEALQAQSARAGSEQQFRALFAALTEGVVLQELVRDAEGVPIDYRLLAANPAYAVHTGLRIADVIGKLGSEVYGTGKAPYLEEVAAVIATRSPLSFEMYHAPFHRHYRLSIAPMTAPSEQVAVVFDEITDRKKREAELQQKNEEIMRFTYAVSHDLKSPLVTIQTFLGYLERDLARHDAARVEKDYHYIRKAAARMSRMLDELLLFSRLGRTANPLEESPFTELVNEALTLVGGRLEQRGVQVEVLPSTGMLYGDRQRLVEVFQSLIDNAVKFMGQQAAPRIEIGTQMLNGEAAHFVRDNGIGIDPRYQQKVFHLFEKLDPEVEGSGVGLALVKRIVEMHGGRIWAESQGVGHGTTIWFVLRQAYRRVA
jgi:signal transduction histidine kinase